MPKRITLWELGNTTFVFIVDIRLFQVCWHYICPWYHYYYIFFHSKSNISLELDQVFIKKCLQSWDLRFGHLYVTANSDKNSETFKRIFYETLSIYSSWSGAVHYAEVEMGRWDLIGILNFQEKSLTIDHLKGKCHVQFLIQWVLLKSLRLK